MHNTQLSLIVCTYMRPVAICTLLDSVQLQSTYPDEILIIDGSTDDKTEDRFRESKYKNLSYFKVPPEHRGLTKQRNYGIDLVGDTIEIVCFLDDDIVLETTYFEEILKTYQVYPDALGVGGYIVNEVSWKKVNEPFTPAINQFYFDGYVRSDGSRYVLRKKLGLDANRPPGYLPTFSHGRSISFLPPSGKIYPVEQLMGGVASYKIAALKSQKFSEYFEGYGLYEDADYTLRLSKKGPLYINTNAQLHHYHDPGGRPNHFKYGKMVIRNGWYIWRSKYPKPTLEQRFLWNLTAYVLTLVRLSNSLRGNDKKAAFSESLGRIVGWLSLIFNKPKHI
ncbi:glycosyltransferase family A protein [uncultured Dokdonia sp.]|uniref:glycosyltransferase family 2 protein n=1 Tax=uncultured Dokdonia sp. TaxID=575653 RepID=UPI0026098FBD|nr:glycosyltransferase family A protein [uncultured Dokdonia sp.]